MAVAAMPDGKRILGGGSDSNVWVWRLDGTRQKTIWVGTSDVRALVALPDNQHAISASSDSSIKLFNVNDGAVLRTFYHHTNSVLCLALMPDGRRFVTGSSGKVARIVEHGLAPQ